MFKRFFQGVAVAGTVCAVAAHTQAWCIPYSWWWRLVTRRETASNPSATAWPHGSQVLKSWANLSRDKTETRLQLLEQYMYQRNRAAWLKRWTVDIRPDWSGYASTVLERNQQGDGWYLQRLLDLRLVSSFASIRYRFGGVTWDMFRGSCRTDRQADVKSAPRCWMMNAGEWTMTSPAPEFVDLLRARDFLVGGGQSALDFVPRHLIWESVAKHLETPGIAEWAKMNLSRYEMVTNKGYNIKSLLKDSDLRALEKAGIEVD